MTRDDPRVLIGYGLALVLAMVGAAPAVAKTVAGTDSEAAELVAELPWAFELESEPTEPGSADELVRTTRHRFKSTTTTAAGDVYLRAELTTYEHGDAGSARAALAALLAGADPDTGLSYAWDRLLLSGAVVYRLHAGCSWSEETWKRVAGRLEAMVPRPDLRVGCRCGGGCRELPALPE